MLLQALPGNSAALSPALCFIRSPLHFIQCVKIVRHAAETEFLYYMPYQFGPYVKYLGVWANSFKMPIFYCKSLCSTIQSYMHFLCSYLIWNISTASHSRKMRILQIWVHNSAPAVNYSVCNDFVLLRELLFLRAAESNEALSQIPQIKLNRHTSIK